MPRLALDLHRATVCFDEAHGYGEPQPGARCAALLGTCPGLFAAEGAFEDAWEVFRRYALACVGDLDLRHVTFRLRAQGYGTVRWGVTEGVRDQVVEHALESGWVREHGIYVTGDLSEQAYALPFGLRLEA